MRVALEPVGLDAHQREQLGGPLARLAAVAPPAPWARSVSPICSPMVSTGLSASMALWKTMERRFQRTCAQGRLVQAEQVLALEEHLARR